MTPINGNRQNIYISKILKYYRKRKTQIPKTQKQTLYKKISQCNCRTRPKKWAPLLEMSIWKSKTNFIAIWWAVNEIIFSIWKTNNNPLSSLSIGGRSIPD